MIRTHKKSKHISLYAVLFSCLVVLFSACNTTPPAVPDFSLSLSDSNITIAQGASGDVTVTVTPTGGFADAVNLSVSGAPAGVTASFNPPSTASSSVLTLTVAASATVGNSTLTITGTAGSLSDEATLTLNVEAPPVTTITVSGTVLDFAGQPAPNATVLIFGKGTVITDADGEFSVSDVTVPYDAAVIISGGGTSGAVVYRGLTRSDPTLLFFGGGGSSFSATVDGTISGGGIPSGLNHVARVAFGSPETSDSTSADVITGLYSENIFWQGPSSTTGNLHALHWEQTAAAPFVPVAFKGYGVKTGVSLSDGGTFSGQDITMIGVSEESISGTISLPAGYSLSGKSLNVDFGDRASIGLFSDSSATTSFNYLTPDIAGATMRLAVSATHPSGAFSSSTVAGLAPDASGISVDLPAAPTLSVPVNAATGVDTDTNFGWSNFAGGVHFVMFQPAAATDPVFIVFTADANTSIPDLSAQGLGLPPAANYQWAVIGIAPIADMDEFASGNLADLIGGTASISISNSVPRTFTTAP